VPAEIIRRGQLILGSEATVYSIRRYLPLSNANPLVQHCAVLDVASCTGIMTANREGECAVESVCMASNTSTPSCGFRKVFVNELMAMEM